MTNIRCLATLCALLAAFAVPAGAQVPPPAPPPQPSGPRAFPVPPLPPQPPALPVISDPTEIFDEVREALEQSQSALAAAFAASATAQAPVTSPSPRPVPSPPAFPVPPAPPVAAIDSTEALYDQAREAIEQNQYDRAVEQFNRLIVWKTPRTDAAMYWKAYSLAKLTERTAALTTLAELEKQFAGSRWIKDAKALEVEIRQASGQAVTVESQNDEELKLLALRGLMQSDPDRSLPILERMLSSQNSLRVKDRALFVLSQSRSPRTRELIAGIAKGNANPDLQLKAIRYLGIMGGTDTRDLLAEIYRGSSDVTVKRAVLRSYMTSGDRDRLLALAKSEPSPELRGEAVQQLGALGASAALFDLYQTETSMEIKKRILRAIAMGGGADRVIALAKTEKDPELRRTAIQSLGMMGRTDSTEALTSIYAADQSLEIRKAVVQALFIQHQAKTLVDLARAEKNPELKKDIVTKLSMMRSKDATDYLLELLK
jgi:HEAT repeat protein